jgi:hypothetical protein
MSSRRAPSRPASSGEVLADRRRRPYARVVREPLVEQVRYDPPPVLRPYVASYTGYRLDGVPPGAHAGLPSKSLTFIVSFDDPLDIAEMPDDRQAPDTFWAMVGGLHVRPATVRHDGRQHGVQIELTPLGAMALFGTRPGDLASTLVHLDDPTVGSPGSSSNASRCYPPGPDGSRCSTSSSPARPGPTGPFARRSRRRRRTRGTCSSPATGA